MPILVIGGTGFIGPRVIRRLVERGEQVVCMDINPGSASFAAFGDQVKVVFGDITDFSSVIRTVIETHRTASSTLLTCWAAVRTGPISP